MDLSKPLEVFTDRAFLAGVGGAVVEAVIEKIAFTQFRPVYGYQIESNLGSIIVANDPRSNVPDQQKFINRQGSRLAATAAVMFLASGSGNPAATSAAIGFGVVAIAHILQDLFPAQLLQPARK